MENRPNSRQLYLQVLETLKRCIKDGTYKEDEKLPSEFQLAKNLGVSRATLREALRVLEEENLVTRRHGIGTFVNPKPIFSSGIEELRSVTHMIEKSGKKPGVQYITTKYINADEDICKKLQLNKNEEISKIERVRTADNEPVVYCVDKMPKEFISLESIAKENSLFQAIEKQTDIRITYAVTHIEPISYTPSIDHIYDILDCHQDQPLLLLKQMHYTKDEKSFLYSSNYFRSDRFSFYVLRRRM